jgi:hypothetical protein
VGLRVEVVGDGFQVLLNPPPYSVTEYLAWSEQFTPAFDAMREALKRPLARMDGDYQQPYAVPTPNFLALRSAIQTLSQRAQCFLLLNQPDAALRELTLIHELNRSLDSRPMTLVAAMIVTAVSGMYVDVVAEGLHRQTWQEPQLAVIQNQLQQMNLAPLVAESLRAERAGLLHIVQSAQTEVLADYITRDLPKRLLGLTSRTSCLPRGWFEQNYVVMANMQQTLIESLDVTNRLVFPVKASRFSDELSKMSRGFRPHTFVAAVLIPDFSKAIKSLAFQQVRVDEAQVACALERHRVATGEFPETLAALAPQFLGNIPHDIIGGQPLKYRRAGSSGFVLYSVGWNETDEHGIAQVNLDGSVDTLNGDWVWQPFEGRKGRLLTAN